jgi:hypothetical protein
MRPINFEKVQGSEARILNCVVRMAKEPAETNGLPER